MSMPNQMEADPARWVLMFLDDEKALVRVAYRLLPPPPRLPPYLPATRVPRPVLHSARPSHPQPRHQSRPRYLRLWCRQSRTSSDFVPIPCSPSPTSLSTR